MEDKNPYQEFDYVERERMVRRKNMLHDLIWVAVLAVLCLIFLAIVIFL